MKSPQTAGNSGSSTGSKKVASHPTGSGVKKSSAPTKKASKVVQATGGESPQQENKWQAFFDSAREVSADNETVRTRLLEVLKETRSEKDAEKDSSKNTGECPAYDVKGLMAQIYQDIHTVAAAQASEANSGEAQTERICPGELSDPDLSLREVSVGVTSVIKSALAHLYNPEYPQSCEIWDIDEKMARCLSHDDPTYERYGKLAAQPGWKFLSKLAHSAAFRDAACTLDASAWQMVSASIDENAISLMVFAEGYGLEWWTELIRLNSLFPPSLDFTKYPSLKSKTHFPHKWVVTENFSDLHRPEFQGKRQIDIRDNIYRDHAFRANQRPSCWPAHRPYPEDPTIVHDWSIRRCIACHSHTPCACSFTASAAIRHPLVELRHYGAKGVGVRALERIPSGAILGEYVGEVFPRDYTGDPVYALDFSMPGRGCGEVVATISARRFGNWTRFVNHSCEASTRFGTVMLGGRYRSVVQAVRAIEVFEEVTVDYGDGYWRDRTCGCGVEGCCEGVKRKGEVEVEGPESWGLSKVVCED